MCCASRMSAARCSSVRYARSPFLSVWVIRPPDSKVRRWSRVRSQFLALSAASLACSVAFLSFSACSMRRFLNSAFCSARVGGTLSEAVFSVSFCSGAEDVCELPGCFRMRLDGTEGGGGISEYCFAPFSSSQMYWAPAGVKSASNRMNAAKDVVWCVFIRLPR